MALQDDPEAMQRINTQTRRVEDAALTEGAALPEPCFEGCDVYSHKAPAASFEALRALITGCLLAELPTVKSSPSLRWYDARARAAALRVAHWLRVPRASCHALELELMGDAPASEAMEVSQSSLHSYHSTRMKWLKVGAAAVGGGVLTAVTAGLAAPAIVAGVGTLVGLTGSAGAQPPTNRYVAVSTYLWRAVSVPVFTPADICVAMWCMDTTTDHQYYGNRTVTSVPRFRAIVHGSCGWSGV